jgi:hypothetical protein
LITRDENKTTLEELKLFLGDEIKAQYVNISKNYLYTDIYKYIIEDYKMDLPMEFMKKWLVSEKDNNLTPETVEKELSNIEKQVKWDVVSNQFATQNEIKVEFEEIKNEFEKDIRGFTLNQGRILLKLIDRETGNSSFALVKDLRGNFQAFFWQSVARIFSVNLKSEYDPLNNSEDKLIEEIVISIENGTFTN